MTWQGMRRGASALVIATALVAAAVSLAPSADARTSPRAEHACRPGAASTARAASVPTSLLASASTGVTARLDNIRHRVEAAEAQAQQRAEQSLAEARTRVAHLKAQGHHVGLPAIARSAGGHSSPHAKQTGSTTTASGTASPGRTTVATPSGSSTSTTVTGTQQAATHHPASGTGSHGGVKAPTSSAAVDATSAVATGVASTGAATRTQPPEKSTSRATSHRSDKDREGAAKPSHAKVAAPARPSVVLGLHQLPPLGAAGVLIGLAVIALFTLGGMGALIRLGRRTR